MRCVVVSDSHAAAAESVSPPRAGGGGRPRNQTYVRSAATTSRAARPRRAAAALGAATAAARAPPNALPERAATERIPNPFRHRAASSSGIVWIDCKTTDLFLHRAGFPRRVAALPVANPATERAVPNPGTAQPQVLAKGSDDDCLLAGNFWFHRAGFPQRVAALPGSNPGFC